MPPPPITGYPVGLNAAKTCFLDQNGNPCFACGDAPQYLSEQLQKSDIELYLSDRASRGINIGWWIIADKLYQSNPPNDAYGNAPFSGGDFLGMASQTAYWNYIDYVLGRALTYGITMIMMPAFMGLDSASGYQTAWKAASDATLQGYAAFLGARYSGFKNVIWLIGGDADPADTTLYAKLNTFAVALKSADPGHLITLEASRFTGGSAAPNGGYSSIDACGIALGSTPSWLDINWVYQTASTCASGAQRCYTQGLPCLLGEDWYELEHSETALSLRTEAYGAVLGGCTLGRLFGNGVIWPFNSTSAASGNVQSPTWQSQLGSAGSVGQQLLGNLFRSRRHQLLVPDISNATMTVGAASGSVCARDSEGKTIIAYLPSSQTITIDMTKITDAGGFANCNWLNPSTGAVTTIGNLANTGTHNFTSPDSNDWVLVIDSASAGFRTPGT
jgi:hypothetical protein